MVKGVTLCVRCSNQLSYVLEKMVLFDFVIYRLNQGLQWIVGFTFCKTGKPTIHMDLNNLVYLRLG